MFGWDRNNNSIIAVVVWLLMVTNVWSMVVSTSKSNSNCFVGFDLGTSGIRVSVIDEEWEELFSSSLPWKEYDDVNSWLDGTHTLLERIPLTLRQQVQSICVSGTSASCLLIDATTGQPTSRSKPRMYNYDVTTTEDGIRAMSILDTCAPEKHTTRATTSSLAKLLTWNQQKNIDSKRERLVHQSDYISMKLLHHGRSLKCGSAEPPIEITSDVHNCLKLGYNVLEDEWPEWMYENDKLMNDILNILPKQVISPGQPMGTISETLATEFQLPKNCVVVGGTTDSNAAFFAAASPSKFQVGTAVTSLGSTLAMKQLSSTYLEDATCGIYSHLFPSTLGGDQQKLWLIGGASNVGCAVLRQEDYTTDELITLSQDIDPTQVSPLNYYPLAVAKGERFPVANPQKVPLLEPKPESRREYLHGILQGIAKVEVKGFQTFVKMGASLPTHVYTCGGGSQNSMWTTMRQFLLEQETNTPIPVSRAINTEASYGAAILASATFL